MPVPDGLEGQRVDQALARMFGISRGVAADLADAGVVVVDGRPRGKGDRLTGGSWLEVELPPPPGEPPPLRPVVGMTILHDDDDVESLHERIKAAERGMLVESVGRMAREGFTITDRKVRFGRE